MDFRKLIYFEAVCREKSFTKAAQRLHITQPSVTMAVRDLEHDLNVCLIDRRRGELTPTPEGEYILQKARHLIQELEQTEQEIHTFLQKQKGGVRIGYAIQMRNALSKLLNRFRAEYSDITVAEHESSTPAIIAQLQRGALDLGIIAVSKGWEKALHIHPLYQGELRVCVSRQNPLSQAQSVTLEQFEHQPLVSLAIKNPLDSYIFRILQDAYPDAGILLPKHCKQSGRWTDLLRFLVYAFPISTQRRRETILCFSSLRSPLFLQRGGSFYEKPAVEPTGKTISGLYRKRSIKLIYGNINYKYCTKNLANAIICLARFLF